MRRAGGAHRPRPQGADQPALACSTARTTSIRTCRRATRSASTRTPIVGEGEVEVDCDDGAIFACGIERLHLEQDAGKSIHDQHPDGTYVDLNRAGVALMEIVSKPDMRSSEEAKAYVTKLRTILRYLGTCDGDMEKGNLRADVNVSVRRPGDAARHALRDQERQLDPLHRQAIEYEARRQIEIIEDGGTIDQETRLFDAGQGRDPLDAHQGGGARLPLFPRSRPAAARARSRPTSRSSRAALPELPDAEEGALHRRVRPRRLRRRRAGRRARERRLLRGGGAAPTATRTPRSPPTG